MHSTQDRILTITVDRVRVRINKEAVVMTAETDKSVTNGLQDQLSQRYIQFFSAPALLRAPPYPLMLSNVLRFSVKMSTAFVDTLH